MSTIVTSGERNGKVYKVTYNGSYFELLIYNREQDQFVKHNGEIFNSIEEIEAYLDSHFGVVSP